MRGTSSAASARTGRDAAHTRESKSETAEAVVLLREQLDHERTRRRAAEELGEKATADLLETVRELQRVQAEILENADRARIINDLAREMRQELDSASLLDRAARAVGEATLVDRCQVHVIEPAAMSADWAHDDVALPDALPLTWQPISVLQLLQSAEHEHADVVVTDLHADPRFDEAAASDVEESLGVQALLACPMWVGHHLVGWLVLHSRAPREWSERELAICQGLASDLGATLLQVQSYEQQHESMRRLRELDVAKDAFISNVSHELRTPLTSISGYLELISAGEFGPVESGLQRAVDVVGRNTERLRALVEDLLALSAYDASEVRLERSCLHLGTMLEECHGALAPIIARRHLVVRVHVADDLRTIQADRTQLERVVLNLLSNAVKFTPDGGTVMVTADNTVDGVVLTVEDTGIGIPASEQERIFTRFFRSSLSMSAEIQGTGLGLALTKTLVEQHGGSVELASEEGAGTCVTVRLPRGA